jgi:C1A family cysteine protease
MDKIDWIKFQPSPDDSRDKIVASTNAVLPKYVDLIPDVEEIENQAYSSSCTANAAASALEITYKRAGKSKDFSRLYNYWYSRVLGGLKGDIGAYPRDVCRALNKHGICLESTWDFDLLKNLNIEPSLEAQEEAKSYPIHEYSRIEDPDVVESIKRQIASGIPVMTTIKVSKSFYELGIIYDWKQHDWNPDTDFIGFHQVVIIGYDDKTSRFLAQNSWGNRWADGGFFGIPYEKVGIDYTKLGTASCEYWVLNRLDVPYIPVTDEKETDPINPIISERKKNKIQRDVITAFILLCILCMVYYSYIR